MLMTMVGSAIRFFKAHLMLIHLVVVTLSGTGGEILRTFDIQTGVLLLEKQLHLPQLGHRAEPHTLGKHVVFGDNNSTDIYVLTNGYNFARMNRETGETYWEFASPDARFAINADCFTLC